MYVKDFLSTGECSNNFEGIDLVKRIDSFIVISYSWASHQGGATIILDLEKCNILGSVNTWVTDNIMYIPKHNIFIAETEYSHWYWHVNDIVFLGADGSLILNTLTLRRDLMTYTSSIKEHFNTRIVNLDYVKGAKKLSGSPNMWYTDYSLIFCFNDPINLAVEYYEIDFSYIKLLMGNPNFE